MYILIRIYMCIYISVYIAIAEWVGFRDRLQTRLCVADYS